MSVSASADAHVDTLLKAEIPNMQYANAACLFFSKFVKELQSSWLFYCIPTWIDPLATFAFTFASGHMEAPHCTTCLSIFLSYSHTAYMES